MFKVIISFHEKYVFFHRNIFDFSPANLFCNSLSFSNLFRWNAFFGIDASLIVFITKFAIWGNFNLSNLEFENIKNEIQ